MKKGWKSDLEEWLRWSCNPTAHADAKCSSRGDVGLPGTIAVGIKCDTAKYSGVAAIADTHQSRTRFTEERRFRLRAAFNAARSRGRQHECRHAVVLGLIPPEGRKKPRQCNRG